MSACRPVWTPPFAKVPSVTARFREIAKPTMERQLNKSQYDARLKQYQAAKSEIDSALNDAIETKSYSGLDDLQKCIDELADEKAELDRYEETHKGVDPRIAAVAASGGDLGQQHDAPNANYQLGAKGLGKDVYPFGLPRQEVRKAYDAVKRGGNYIIEAKGTDGSGNPFTSVESLLVPQQAPGIVPEYFESRLLDHLPVTTISAPSYQFLQHQFASDTGGPGFVAEGQTKPQWNPAAEKVIVTAEKIAGYFDISSESLMDAPQWESYLINTLFQLIMQQENHAFLYGAVSDSLGIQGWSTQSGILTHNASADPTGSTNLDSIELAIKQLRVQSGVYAVPNLCIMSPATFSATRRIKSTTGDYIAGNPLTDSVTHVWGIPVITTTAAADGDCFLVDGSKMGSVLVRESISTHMGYSGEGLINNILTVVAEERIALATVIPSAVNYVTNLAAS